MVTLKITDIDEDKETISEAVKKTLEWLDDTHRTYSYRQLRPDLEVSALSLSYAPSVNYKLPRSHRAIRMQCRHSASIATSARHVQPLDLVDPAGRRRSHWLKLALARNCERARCCANSRSIEANYVYCAARGSSLQLSRARDRCML